MKSVLTAVGGFLLDHILLFLAVALILNLIALALYGIDKRKAIKKKWRIPEATLILSAWIGGAAGALGGMLLFRHKTKHIRFLILVPLAFLVYTAFFGASLIFALIG